MISLCLAYFRRIRNAFMAKISQGLYKKYSRILNTGRHQRHRVKSLSTHVQSVSPPAEGEQADLVLSFKGQHMQACRPEEKHIPVGRQSSPPSAHSRLNLESQQKPFSFDFSCRFRVGSPFPTFLPFLYVIHSV